jgi:hypothetical protein
VFLHLGTKDKEKNAAIRLLANANKLGYFSS